MPPGPLIGRGRDADVYASGPGRVLRRYRRPHATLDEAAVMRHVREQGYPAPEVFEVSGPDITMERADGPTMLADLSRRPWRLASHARLLAQLHQRLHVIPAPDWFPEKLGGGPSVVHFDLHPDNVVLTRRGPVVIDWTNGGRGPGAADVAQTWVIMATSVIPGGRWRRNVLGGFRELFVRRFLRHFDVEQVRPHLRGVAAHRMSDRNVLDEERETIERLLRDEALTT